MIRPMGCVSGISSHTRFEAVNGCLLIIIISSLNIRLVLKFGLIVAVTVNNVTHDDFVLVFIGPRSPGPIYVSGLSVTK